MPLTIPDELLTEAGLSEGEARLEIACRLYDANKLSMPQAGRWAGVSRTEFEAALIERHLPLIRIDKDYWSQGTRGAGKAEALAMRIVVSDTSPVRALHHLGHLTLLEAFFDSVLLPPAVALELARPPAGLAPVDSHDFSFLKIKTPSNSDVIQELLLVLDLGEAEAITLAEEIKAEAILIDERAGRLVACQRGHTVLGTLGILLRAKEVGLCTDIRPLLDRLQFEINFFVSPTLRTIILRQAGEA